MEDWIDRLNKHMEEREITQQELSRRLDMTYQAINHWFRRRRSPDTLEQFERIAEAAGCSVAWMLFGVGPEEPITSEDIDLARAIHKLPPGAKSATLALLSSLTGADRTGTDD